MSKTSKINHKHYKKARVKFVDNLKLDFQVHCGEIILDRSKADRNTKNEWFKELIEEELEK